MISQESVVPLKLQDGELWDDQMQAAIKIQQSQFRVRYLNGNVHHSPIPVYPQTTIPTSSCGLRSYLKFMKMNNPNISVNPSGLSLICKSERVQEVQTNKTFSQGIHYWSIFCANSCLGLTIGIKDKKSKKQYVFDFSNYGSKTMKFKLDLQSNVFKCWVNDIVPFSKKPITIESADWTPFVRLKENGNTLLLNPFIEDPEAIISPYNIFGSAKYQAVEMMSVKKQMILQKELQKNYQLIRVHQNCLGLVSSNQLKLYFRDQKSNFFNFESINFLKEDQKDNLVLSFRQNDYDYITNLSKLHPVCQLGSFGKRGSTTILVAKTAREWIEWATNLFAYFDRILTKINNMELGKEQMRDVTLSRQQILELYKIVLQNFEGLRPWIDQQNFNYSLGLKTDLLLTWGLDKSVFKLNKPQVEIGKSSFLNSLRPITFNSLIGNVKMSKKFLGVHIKETDRIAIINVECMGFKVGQFGLGKSIKKQIELNQYKHEIEDIQQNNFTQASIYKILKNCLKYADKVKPPENLVKELQNKKKKKEEVVVKSEIVPDQSILNTLENMGFSLVLSKKALIQCKNSSIEAAMDLILNKYNNQPPKFTETTPKTEWTCSICTLINPKATLVCGACSSPPPIVTVEDLPPKIQQPEQKIEQDPVQDVISSQIQGPLKQFFIWDVEIGLCPVLVAGLFEGKIRFRLLGPNPKYYSNFYIKQDGFIDYTSLQIHEYAHEIKQQPIQYLNYLTSNKNQQKENGFGWINIEDFDIQEKDKVNHIEISFEKVQKNVLKFTIDILKSNKTHYIIKSFKAKINIENIYVEKKKALSIHPSEQFNHKIQFHQQGQIKIANKLISFKRNQNGLTIDAKYTNIDILKPNQTIIPNTNVIPRHGQLELRLTNDHPIMEPSTLNFISSKRSFHKERTLEKPYLSLLVYQGPAGSNLTYPGCVIGHDVSGECVGMYPHRLVLKSQIGGSMIVDSLTLERVGKSKAGNSFKYGFVYICNDLGKQPLIRYEYEFDSNNKRIYVNLGGEEGTYLVIVPTGEKNDDTQEDTSNFQISFMGAQGRIVERQLITEEINQIPTNLFNKQIKPIIQSSKGQNVEYNMQVLVTGCRFELSTLVNDHCDRVLEAMMKQGIPIDLKVRLSVKQTETSEAILSNIELTNWREISRKSRTTNKIQRYINQSEYSQCLERYLKGDEKQFEILKQSKYSHFRYLISSKNLNNFVKNCLIHCPNDKRLKSNYSNFIRMFSTYITNHSDLDGQSLLEKSLNDPSITAVGLELLFELLKICKPSESKMVQKLKELGNQVQQTRNPGYKDLRKQGNVTLQLEKTIFSDYYHQQLHKNQSNNLQIHSAINQKCLLIKGNFFRKYVIDMLSAYKIQHIILLFDKSNIKAKFRIKISSFNSQNQRKLQFEQFYHENTWNQLTKSAYSQQMQKMFSDTIKNGLNMLRFNLPNVISRYLIVEIYFTLQPYLGSKKSQNSIPQSQIIPEVYGQYYGQSQPNLGHLFSFKQQNTIFISKTNNVSKCSVKSSRGQNCFYYDTEEREQDFKMQSIQQIHKQMEKGSYKETTATIKSLMKFASKDNLNYLYTVLCLMIENLICRQNLKIEDLDWQILVDILINNEKGPISDKFILLLAKLVKDNQISCQSILKIKFTQDTIVNQIFKDSGIKSELILRLLQENPLSTNLLTNVIWMMKFREETSNQVLEKIVDMGLKEARLKDILFMFEKFGWIKGTDKVIQSLSQDKKQAHIKVILRSSRNNQQLCDLAQRYVFSDFQMFRLAYQQLNIPSRNTKSTEVKNLIHQLLNLTKTLIQQKSQESDINQKFNYALKMSNHFGADQSTSHLLIQTFFIIPSKNIFLKQFFNSQTIYKPDNHQKLLCECLKMLNHQIFHKSEHSKHEQYLTIINDILCFTLSRNSQADCEDYQSNKPFSKESTLFFLQTFSYYLIKYLNLGGMNNIKMVDSETNLKITLGFYLNCLCSDTNVYPLIQENTIKNYIKWAMINIRNSNESSLKMKVGIRFNKIQQKVWSILKAQSSSHHPEVFSKIFIQQYHQLNKELKLIKNPTIRTIYEIKAMYLIQKMLEEFSKVQSSIIYDLMKNKQLFDDLLTKIIDNSNQDIAEDLSIKEEELANSLTFLNNPDKEAPKDWLVHKNGAKNAVFTVEYPPQQAQQSYEMIFTSSNRITLSRVIIGFEYSSNEAKPSCIPKQIIVEGGETIEKMQVLGKMQMIPDDHYINYSVKVFGLNCNRFDSLAGFVGSANKNPYIHVLRLTIKPSENLTISDALSLNPFSLKSSSSSVNFLSVQGYCHNHISKDMSSVVKSIQILSHPQHKPLIEELFNQESVVKLFQESLINISHLMKFDAYEKTLHNFLMRVCQKNTHIGDQMVAKYLHLENSYLCAKISSQIVLSNPQSISRRTQTFFDFIAHSLKHPETHDQLQPFLQRFNQIVFIISNIPNINPTITLNIPTDLIFNLQTGTQNQIKFIKTLLTLKDPFKVEGLVLEQVLKFIKNKNEIKYKDLYGGLIVSDKKVRSWFMENHYFEECFEETKNLIINKDSIQKLAANMRFLSSICQNTNIKSLINKHQYNLRIFELLLHQQYHKILTQQNNKCLRQNFVSFIANSSLGSENEKIVGAMLKDSLSTVMSQGNKNFANQIFLPLLNSFTKVSVSLVPYSSLQNRLITDISNYRFSKINPPAKSVGKAPVNKFRLPTPMMNDKEKEKLFSHLKTKYNMESGHFNLVLNHDSYGSGMSEIVQNKVLKSNTSKLFLFKTKSASIQNNHQSIVGLFYSKDQNKDHNTNTLHWTKDSFAFRLVEGSQIVFIDSEKTKDTIMVQLRQELSYEQGGQSQDILSFYYNSNIFLEVFFSYQMESYFQPSSLGKMGNEDLLSQQPQNIHSVEYWSFQNPVNEVVPNAGVGNLKMTEDLLSGFSYSNYFRKTFEAEGANRILRYQKVYEFPSSITIRQLKQSVQILNCSVLKDNLNSLKFCSLSSTDNYSDTTTLEQILKNNNSEDNIIDLRVNFDNIVDILDYSKNKANQPLDFLPKKGILKHFSQNDGVSEMINVLLKSIEKWGNEGRKQKWLQYTSQLQSFTKFPHFFAMYMKDKETMPLLFNLLAGVPDKQNDKKWDQMQNSCSLKLMKIVSDILLMDKTSEFRNFAMKNNFLGGLLEKLKLLTGIKKRQWHQQLEKQNEQVSPSKEVEDDAVKKVKKKKGVGYGNDTSSNVKWMKGIEDESKKNKSEVVDIILNMIDNFFNVQNWQIPNEALEIIYESVFLPYLQEALRAGTLLEISKHPLKFKTVFKLVRTLSNNQKLIALILPIPQNYQPRQTQSIQSLMLSLQKTAAIFISCLSQNQNQNDKNEKISEQLAKDIVETCKHIEQNIDDYKNTNENFNEENQMKDIIELPIDKKYRALLKELRFDYIDMKTQSSIKHHYSSSYSKTYVPNQNKMIRLAQELADIATALPYQYTNGIYVRCDKDRVDYMQALIMGSNGTPYGHGAYLFDIFFEDNYPNVPPKVNLTTTGNGKIRFNPNLYACGKVCLSLLGTWRGSASENWDAKVSTLLQVLVSIQAIIMSEQIYFNEPGFQNEQGTQQGEKKNQAYSNIVRYGNIKFAMTQNIRNPPKGFETVISRHFYVKKHEIMEECNKWLKYANARQANYIGLVNDHNSSWCTEFKKSKTQYKEMLQKAIQELQEQLNKIPTPSINDIMPKNNIKRQKKKQVTVDKLKQIQDQKQEDIDVTYQKNDSKNLQIDINDEKVKDRWSRYIGAMGIDAVSRQSKADILVFGLSPMNMEVIKNIVLSGCRKLTICDDKNVSIQDLSGGFFYSEEDVGKSRLESCLYKIKELNVYVKLDTISEDKINVDFIKTYSLVLATELSFEYQIKINGMCRANNVRFISAECRGAFARLFNDFGPNFQVLDKNGEEPVEVIIKNITNAQVGIVTLLDGIKSPYEDGEVILLKDIQGMASKEDPLKSLNGTLHKVKGINSKSFQIGNTLNYQPYIRNGTAKNIKTPVIVKFPTMKEFLESANQKLLVDENMIFYDFVKTENAKLNHFCFEALDRFTATEKRMPNVWNLGDSDIFLQKFKEGYKGQMKDSDIKFVKTFSMTCQGYLPPLCAFFGGFIAQQIIKGITQKYKPINCSLYVDFNEIIAEMPEDLKEWTEDTVKGKVNQKKHRDTGFEIVVGEKLLSQIKKSKLFMIGAGAIGCELLKNFAMISLGAGEGGKITLTDPDHIENSNLNRQFLFRQKHISKPKSRTAAATILMMNPHLKDHVSALLERVSQSTKDIFSNKFFESLNIVANALDNVAARRYVDQRCVENKVALFQSGTLGPKGHVQVIIPFLTESYGSQNDPVEQGQIPHCTLKMFPEETLHCVEWARDMFGKKFTLQPKGLLKVLDKGYKPQKDDVKTLNQSLVMLKKGPRNFDDCIAYATLKFYKYFRDDVAQLLYTYPLNSKTKNGEPFWKLPKRPPTPLEELDPTNILHSTFITSLAVLLAKIYKIPSPKSFRTDKQRFEIAKMASKIKIPPFVPSDDKAKQILKESEEKKKVQEVQSEEITMVQVATSDVNEQEIFKSVLQLSDQFTIQSEQFEKDDDSNGHIDFIYAAANLRAINYKLDPMDWITTKIKAGRIVPALATTTTCIAGLQTIQICKYVKKVKVDKMKNAYLNLAVPSLQMSEPGEVIKTKINDKVTVNLWDRWQIKCTQQTTFGQVYQKLREMYELKPIGVLQGMSRIDTSKSEADKEQFLKSKLVDKLQKEDDYIDIVVLFTKPEEQKILQKLPPVRLVFKK